MAVIAMVAGSSTAHAEWKVQARNDRMSDKAVKWATLDAKAADHGILAALVLTCDGLDGARLFAVRLSSPLTAGAISARLRIDDNKVRSLVNLRTYSDPHRIPLITAPSYDLWGRKRFRIELFPRGGPEVFYDFDLSGIDKAIAALPCNRAPTETFEDTVN
ncbi:hypothetical protein [Bradyrhizobium diazoefficiens]